VSETRATRINMTNLITLISVAILVGTEILGAAVAGGWAVAGLFELDPWMAYGVKGVFAAIGLWVLYKFVRHAARIEPLRDAA
jgi:Flp pilus assembly pilin Flp